GRDRQSARVHLPPRAGAREVTERGDPVAGNADVADEGGLAGAVVHRAAPDDEIVSRPSGSDCRGAGCREAERQCGSDSHRGPPVWRSRARGHTMDGQSSILQGFRSRILEMKLAPSGRALAPLLVPIAAALLLGGCGELGLRNDPPPESFALADSMADTVTSEPVRRAATRTPERGAYPSAEDVMYGPRPRRDTAQPARPEPPSGPQLSDPVKADLERLVRAQEQHWANTGEYAQRFQHLGLRYVPHAG